MADDEPLVIGPFTFGPVEKTIFAHTRYCGDVSLATPHFRQPDHTCKYMFSTALPCVIGRGPTPEAVVNAMLENVEVWREHIRVAARELGMFLKPTPENWIGRIDVDPAE